MFTELTLQNVKNFRDADLNLGPFTVLVGANASGKSNLRDAFRFLHGIGRGYTLGEILEGTYGDGGEKVWNEIRGGAANMAFQNAPEFEIGVRYDGDPPPSKHYQIRVELGRNQENGERRYPRSAQEKLLLPDETIFEAPPNGKVRIQTSTSEEYVYRELDRTRPILRHMSGALHDPYANLGYAFEQCLSFGLGLHNIRFPKFDPQKLCRSSKAAQTTLGDRGQNLASVLMKICENERKKATLVEWLSTLTPMDASDLLFEVADRSNEVTLILVENDGTETPMQSASDGTLRFLGLLALLFQDDPPGLLFIEELETGLHPTRLDLLVNLIEQRTQQTETQVIATTHSPQLLHALSDDTLEHAQLVYRTGEGPEAKICPLLDVPSTRKVLEKSTQDVSRLHRTGWFENAMAFSGDEKVVS